MTLWAAVVAERLGFDADALTKARSVVTSFKAFIEEHKEEIEAIRILYGRPYRAGLRYGQVKDLALKLGVPPFYVDAKKPEVAQSTYGAASWASPHSGHLIVRPTSYPHFQQTPRSAAIRLFTACWTAQPRLWLRTIHAATTSPRPDNTSTSIPNMIQSTWAGLSIVGMLGQ